MGLDMYLEGRKLYKNFYDSERAIKEDGFSVREKVLDLGYWRKHPNLHGWIVNNFADGVDDCRPIDLSVESIGLILDAVEKDLLEKTTGFFFGASPKKTDGEHYLIVKHRTIDIFKKAIEWVNTWDEETYRYLVYRASW